MPVSKPRFNINRNASYYYLNNIQSFLKALPKETFSHLLQHNTILADVLTEIVNLDETFDNNKNYSQ
jgi:hypothetical protein